MSFGENSIAARSLCALFASEVVDVDAVDVRAGERLVGEAGGRLGRKVLHAAGEPVPLRVGPLDAVDGARAQDGTIRVRIGARVRARNHAVLHVHLDGHARLTVERVGFTARAG